MIDLDNLFKSEEKIEPTVVGGAMGMEPIPVEEHVSVNTEHILEEWSYRCESGYPIYGKREDMIHLQNILDENNIPLPFNRITEDDTNIHTEVPLVQEAVATKEDLIQLIQTTDLPDNVLQYIARQIDGLSSESSVIQALRDKRYDEQTAKRIFDKAVELDSYSQLRAYLANQSKAIAFKTLGSSGNLKPILSKTKLSTDFTDWLFLYKPTFGGVKSGNGENLLRVILRGGHVPKKGDVGIPEGSIEMKVSILQKGFRLTGQSGYGNGFSVAKYVFDELAKLHGKSLDASYFEIEDGTQYQLYYDSNDESLADTIVKDLLKKKRATKQIIVRIYAEALKRAYTSYNGKDLERIVAASIDNSGKLDTKKLFPKLAAFEFRYYADAEEWQALMVMNEKMDYIILDKEMPFDELEDLFSKRFKLNAPNTKAKSTIQDSRVGFKFKG
jgi:hypothetical protein